MSWKARPWLIQGGSGEATTYGELLDRVNVGSVRPLCRPGSTADALGELAIAIGHHAELTLLDPDTSDGDLATLGFAPETVNRRIPLGAGAAVTLEQLRQRAGGSSKARLGLFTSGSTGLPKLVRQPVGNLARAVKTSPRHAEAVWAFAYNPTHVAGIQVCLQALANGCPLVDVHGLDRATVLAAMERHGVTHISATPSFYRLLLPADKVLPGVRSVTLGGESADAGLITRLRGLFPAARFHNIYASTEAGTLLVAEGDVFGIADGLEDRVRIRDGRIHVHAGLLGEFVGGGQRSEDGARASRDATQGSSGPASSGTGEEWYDTGDVVEVVTAEPLRFRIVARERDWVNVGGSKVNPREVEAALEEHPGVRQARVSGRANSVMGHILVAEIECTGSPPAEAVLREHLAARLQPFKVPRLIRFVNSIEQTRTGKVSRR